MRLCLFCCRLKGWNLNVRLRNLSSFDKSLAAWSMEKNTMLKLRHQLPSLVIQACKVISALALFLELFMQVFGTFTFRPMKTFMCSKVLPWCHSRQGRSMGSIFIYFQDGIMNYKWKKMLYFEAGLNQNIYISMFVQ